MTPQFIFLAHVVPQSVHLDAVHELFARNNLTFGRSWSNASYFIDADDCFLTEGIEGEWWSIDQVATLLARGQTGFQTAVSLEGLAHVLNLGFFTYAGKSAGILEISHHALEVLGGRCQSAGASIESFFLELATTLRARSALLGWECAVDTLLEVASLKAPPERLVELASGAEIRFATGLPSDTSEILETNGPLRRRTLHGTDVLASWFPGIAGGDDVQPTD